MFESTYNTLKPEFLQVHALNPFVGMISASRGDMFASEIGQAPPLRGSEVRRIQTGMEREFGKYTFMVKMPEDAVIIKVIHKRSPKGMLGDRITTATTVIYQTVNGQYEQVTVPVHCLNHQQFGFDYVRTSKMNSLMPGQHIPRDTILAHSPSLTPNGDYKYGINGNIAFMSIPECIQDGAVISESFAKKATFKGYGTRVLSIGGTTVGLNIHGDFGDYKLFPDVGDYLPDSGLCFATRELSEHLTPVQLSRYGLRVEEETDRCIYGEPRARVIDVDIDRNRGVKSTLPTGTDQQCIRYWELANEYYKEIVNTFNQICAREGTNNPQLNGPLHSLVREAYAKLNHSDRNASNISLENNGNPLNEWTVTITFSYDLVPTDGFKLADDEGGKAVVVAVWPDDRMPVDAAGNRADVIMDGGSIVNRLNPGRVYEQYITASMHATSNRLREMVRNGQRDLAINTLMEYYQLASPRQAALVAKLPDINRHLDVVLRDGIYLWLPTDNPVYYPHVVKEMRKRFPPVHGPVTYKDAAGNTIQTHRNILIGSQYFIFLEKIGDDYSAVASPVLQHQGIPGKLTRADKHASPGRPQAIRALGETEDRIVASLVDPDAPADMLDMSNSPQTHKHVNRMLLTADKPTNIQNILDRNVVPRGNNRITQHMANHLMAGGFEFEYLPVKE